jgi:hypothetical protein
MKQIKDYPDYYITENGEVISKRTKKEKKLCPGVDMFGYYRISLMSKEGKTKTLRIHRLVMETYGNPPPDDMKDPTVDHINGDKLDNRIDNLQWLSNKDNAYKSKKDKIKTYMIEDMNGDKFIIKNLKKWCKDNNLNRRNMSSTYTKKYYCKGYRIIEKMQ